MTRYDSSELASTRSEAHLVSRLGNFLIQRGYRVRMEVPNMGQSADLVATRNRWVTIIEAKTHDWRRALDQCQAHEQVADFICIAIGTESISKRLLGAINSTNYGLIHCPVSQDSCRWVVKPKMNTRVWSPQRDNLSRTLRMIEYV